MKTWKWPASNTWITWQGNSSSIWNEVKEKLWYWNFGRREEQRIVFFPRQSCHLSSFCTFQKSLLHLSNFLCILDIKIRYLRDHRQWLQKRKRRHNRRRGASRGQVLLILPAGRGFNNPHKCKFLYLRPPPRLMSDTPRLPRHGRKEQTWNNEFSRIPHHSLHLYPNENSSRNDWLRWYDRFFVEHRFLKESILIKIIQWLNENLFFTIRWSLLISITPLHSTPVLVSLYVYVIFVQLERCHRHGISGEGVKGVPSVLMVSAERGNHEPGSEQRTRLRHCHCGHPIGTTDATRLVYCHSHSYTQRERISRI